MTADATGRHVRYRGALDGEAIEIRRTPSGTFVREYGEWLEIDEPSDLAAMLDSAASVPRFESHVPDEMRPFVDVRERGERTLGGRELTLFDLVVDHRSFEAAEPEAAAKWLGSYEMPDRVGGRRITGIALTLWVDGGGIVWQWESNSDVNDGFARGEIVRFDDGPFVLEPPAELVDPARSRRSR